MRKLAIYGREGQVDRAVVFYDDSDLSTLELAGQEADMMLDGTGEVTIEATAELDIDSGYSKHDFPIQRAFVG